MSTTINSTPALQATLQRVSQTPQYHQVLGELRRGARVISISGLVTLSARALVLAALQKETGKRFAIVAPATRDLEPWERNLRFWYCALAGKEGCDNEVLVLPASETDPYAGFSPHAETLEKRALTLWRLIQHSHDFVLLTARALARRMVGPDEVRRTGTTLKRDQEFSPDELVEKLFATGYMREDPVGGIGEFSIRGGIVDIWPPGREAPVRIEFFGDTVDSLREFDPETQLSTGPLSEAEFPPMRELRVNSHDFREWAERARERWSEDRYARALRDRTAFADEATSQLKSFAPRLTSGSVWKFAPWVVRRPKSIKPWPSMRKHRRYKLVVVEDFDIRCSCFPSLARRRRWSGKPSQ